MLPLGLPAQGTGLCWQITLNRELHGVCAAFSLSLGAEGVAPEGKMPSLVVTPAEFLCISPIHFHS